MEKRTVLIAPSLLAADFSRLEQEVRAVEKAGADLIHLDVMDGHFVPNLTFGFPVIEAVARHTKLPLDAHLMVKNPDDYFERYVKAGCRWLSFHVEAVSDPRACADWVRGLGAKVGCAVSPPTPIEKIRDCADAFDFVLVMSVQPGFGGQKFQSTSLDKVRWVRKHFPGIGVEIDGGIGPETAPQVVAAGAGILVAGTAVFGAKDYAQAIRTLRGGA